MAITINNFLEGKRCGAKLTMLTAYDYSMAKLVDGCGIDAILVGDSLGTEIKGYQDTLNVTVDEIVYHTKAVKKGTTNALIVGDMPFMSYHNSTYDAVKNAGRIIQEGGAGAVKLEGGVDVIEQVKGIIKAQIPVMGHVGLTPQSVNLLGGYKVQGKTEEIARKILEDAKKLEEAGVFAIVLECVPYKLAKFITNSISIPTIGIGAGKFCDGQVLVYHDLLNINLEPKKKMVKVFAEVGELMRKGVNDYISEVRDNSFPTEKNSFKIDDEIIEKLS